MRLNRGWKRAVALSLTLLAMNTSAIAIPPPPPAQKGSKASSYTCSSDVMTFKQSWDYSVLKERKFEILINDKDLADADAEKISGEIAFYGPFQGDYAVCTNRGFEMILLRYTPSAAKLHLGFTGRALSRIEVSNASTDFKLLRRYSTE